MLGAPRPGAYVWLSREGRLMRADPTQLRLASGRVTASQELHDSMDSQRRATETAERSTPEHLSDIQESEEDPWTNTPWDVQTDFSDKPAQEQQQPRKRLRKKKKQNPETAKAETARLQVPTRRHLRKRSQTEAQVTQRWRFTLR